MSAKLPVLAVTDTTVDIGKVIVDGGARATVLIRSEKRYPKLYIAQFQHLGDQIPISSQVLFG